MFFFLMRPELLKKSIHLRSRETIPFRSERKGTETMYEKVITFP